MTRSAAALVLLLFFLIPQRAEAQGFIIPEIGARKNAMGAAIGRPDDLSAIYHNPAALTRLRGTRISASFSAAFLETRIRLAPWTGSDKYITDPVDSEGYYPEQSPGIFAPIPFLGASTNLFSDKLVGAVGIYVPNAAGATFGADKASRYHIIDAYVISAYFTAALAYQPLDWLSVGFGMSLAYVRINRKSKLFPVIDGKDLSGILGGDTGVEVSGDDLKPAFSLGVQVWPHETLSLGFVFFTPPLPGVAVEGDLTLDPGADALSLLNKDEAKQNTHRTELGVPWVIGFGANWDITDWLEVGAEFRYYFNSHIDKQVTEIKTGLVKSLLPNGELVTPKNLKDAFHTGGGVLLRPTRKLDLELMTGVHYESSNTPDDTMDVSAPSFDLLCVHIGARLHFLQRRYSLTAAYSRYWYFERTTKESQTSPPTNFKGYAYNNQFSLVFEVAFDSTLAGKVDPEAPEPKGAF